MMLEAVQGGSTMTAPMPVRKFKSLVSAAGLFIEKSGKEWKIVDNAGQYFMSFAISHKKGGKREGKPIYVKRFLSLTE